MPLFPLTQRNKGLQRQKGGTEILANSECVSPLSECCGWRQTGQVKRRVESPMEILEGSEKGLHPASDNKVIPPI